MTPDAVTESKLLILPVMEENLLWSMIAARQAAVLVRPLPTTVHSLIPAHRRGSIALTAQGSLDCAHQHSLVERLCTEHSNTLEAFQVQASVVCFPGHEENLHQSNIGQQKSDRVSALPADVQSV
jgi:hypothetical protein